MSDAHPATVRRPREGQPRAQAQGRGAGPHGSRSSCSTSRVGLSGFAAAHVLRRSGRRLGVDTVRDLLFHLPRRYDDLREMRTLDDLHAAPDGAVVSARVRVTDIRVQQSFRRRVQVTTAFLADETGTAEATWFGRRFIERRLRRRRRADRVAASSSTAGSGSCSTTRSSRRRTRRTCSTSGRIVPVYRLTSGLTAARLRQAMREALDKAGYAYPEYLPAPTCAPRRSVPPIAEALEHAHYPTTFEDRDAALRRLAFDELLALQLGMVARRRARGRRARRPWSRTTRRDRAIRAALEASLARKLGHEAALTADQATAIDEIRGDLARPVPMLRLVQGDVGSGKTAVAAWALAAAALEGRQGALLAPTDLLARQHAATVGDLVEDLAVPVTLLTGLAHRRLRARRRSRRSRPARRGSSSGRTPCSRRPWRSRTSRSPSSTSSTGSASSSAARSRRRRPAACPTSCS